MTSRSACIGLFFFAVGFGLFDSGCFTVTTFGLAATSAVNENFFCLPGWPWAPPSSDSGISPSDAGCCCCCMPRAPVFEKGAHRGDRLLFVRTVAGADGTFRRRPSFRRGRRLSPASLASVSRCERGGRPKWDSRPSTMSRFVVRRWE